MQSYRLTTLFMLTVLLALSATDPSEQRILVKRHSPEIELRTISETSHQNASRYLQAADLRSPFIVLMSGDTISVAQLPMIENGNLSDVYHLIVDSNSPDDLVVDEEFEHEAVADARADDQEKDVREAEDEPGSKLKSGRDSGPADAFELEHQMPSLALVNTSKNNNTHTSLGKSEWQQIASTDSSAVHGREEVWPQMQAAPAGGSRKEDRQTSGAGNEHELGAEEAVGPRKRRRSSRSNSLSDDDGNGGNGSGISGGRSSAATANQLHEYNTDGAHAQAAAALRATRAEESGNAQKVTSAQSSAEGNNNKHKQRETRGAGDDRGRQPQPAEDADKNRRSVHEAANSIGTTGPSSLRPDSLAATLIAPPSASSANSAEGVRFCDFDVHMSLGYAFVADSTGRIHRFRLANAGASPGSGSARAKVVERRKTPPAFERETEAAANSGGENDSTNTIDASARSATPTSSHMGKLNMRTASPAEENTGGPNDSAGSNNIRSEDDGDLRDRLANNELPFHANKVNQHHQSGATQAGAPSAAAEHEERSAANEQRQHPAVSGLHKLSSASVGAPTSVAASSPTAVGAGATVLLHQEPQRGQIVPSESLKPRIIWARNKFSSSKASRATGAKSAQLQQWRIAHGASPAEDGLKHDRDGGSQVVSGRLAEQHEVSEQADVRAAVQSESQQTTSGQMDNGARSNQRHSATAPRRARRLLKTRVAVDWLSNLLFVLDKYRLFVVDFDGNNELLLIDDFNSITRPVDIKVDPVNNFLFWLQAGRFHNTIYKLDLSVLSLPSATQRLIGNTLKLRQSNTRTLANVLSGNPQNDSENVPTGGGVDFDSSDLVALVSHHYAHPIITNLPRDVRLFTIDHKHSRIYVPLSSQVLALDAEMLQRDAHDSSRRDDAEIFAPSDDKTTHLNSTDLMHISSGENCTVYPAPPTKLDGARSQILAYNLDGTDVGPLRTTGENSHIASLDDIQDMTLDTKNNLLYWLTNEGRELFEEYRDGSSMHPAQHNLDGRSYLKLMHFASTNQPAANEPRYNMRKIIQTLATSLSPNRWTRSDGYEQFDENIRASSLNVRQRLGADADASRFSRNAPYIILGVTCLIVITVYLVYSLIFQQMNSGATDATARCRGIGSVDSSSLSGASDGGTHAGSLARGGGHGDWLAPGPSTRSTDTFHHDPNSTSGQVGAYDLESSNYGANNAIDEHYRNRTPTNQSNYCDESNSFDMDVPKLASIGMWPTRMSGVFNKLYVPVEVLQDEALASIRRISIDQLEIEQKAPLGEGHFGTVLQGKITCSERERTNMVSETNSTITGYGPHLSPQDQRTRLPMTGSSSASSGHGSSSSTSGEFVTANSCTEGTTNEDDYLTPRNQLDCAGSDYALDHATCITPSQVIAASQHSTERQQSTKAKLRVAIKKLKDNPSFEEKRDFLQEAKLLASFKHPNIVQLVGICLDQGSTLIVMELMLGGDLIRYMKENTPKSVAEDSNALAYDDLLKICLDIVNGCCYLEDLDYIHRDLAARNCLVSSRKREERVVKLADFGLARDIYKDSYYKKLNDSAMPLKWMAPECLIEQKFTKKSDVWSFGVVMWEVMGYCQEKPYDRVAPCFMKEHLATGARLKRPDVCEEDMYNLMLHCWHMEPECRPTFNECRAILTELRSRKALS